VSWDDSLYECLYKGRKDIVLTYCGNSKTGFVKEGWELKLY